MADSIRIQDLRVGDIIDLEPVRDAYPDFDYDHHMVEYEYATVEVISIEQDDMFGVQTSQGYFEVPAGYLFYSNGEDN